MKSTQPGPKSKHNPEAILCALVLVPNTLARNRFFGLFEDPHLRKVRKRAKRTRAIIRQIQGQGRAPATIIGEQVLEELVVMKVEIPELSYQRTMSLSRLEASLIHYALHKNRGDTLRRDDKHRVELALSQLGDFQSEN